MFDDTRSYESGFQGRGCSKVSAIAISLTLLFVAAVVIGCGLDGRPKARVGYLPTATFGVAFPDPDRLGNHSYGFGYETGGIVYTCKAGHVDIDHIRLNADTTRHLVGKITKTLANGKEGFSFSLTGEMSSHKVLFTYPPDWENNTDKERIIHEIAMTTAPYLAYQATLWHEFLTWFGVHFVGFEPEFNSAFSWEDVYSNLLGTKLGIEAMNNTQYTYNQAMTIALNKKLAELEVQSSEVAVAASDKVRGTWYTGNFIPDTKRRSMDIGLSGSVTPVLIPGVDGCSGPAVPLSVPRLDVLKSHGFSMTHQVKPNVFEQGRIYKAAGSKKIYPEIHYPILMEYIEKQAIQKGHILH